MFNITHIKKISGDTSEMRELAARICRDYLHGAWKLVTAQNIEFKHISGGLSNLLYYISLPESLIKKNQPQGEPKQVLIRVYGQMHGERALESLITESVVFTLLSERGLGPKLHGIFPGGRIEQYINARPLLTKELADEALSSLIAKKMASIHQMEVPLHKEPRWLWDTIDRWLQTCDTVLKKPIVMPPCAKSLLEIVNLRNEAAWLKNKIIEMDCSVVFCHNDMQEGNILMCLDSENNNLGPRLVVIDFEYCSYNYRSFDIANHFVEWMYDYTESKHPYYTEDYRRYPTEKQRLHFINAYLKTLGSNENPYKILKEVEMFTLASHFFWTLWGFINADTSHIPFGYWEYACSRLNCYLQLKHKLTSNGPIKRKVDNVE